MAWLLRWLLGVAFSRGLQGRLSLAHKTHSVSRTVSTLSPPFCGVIRWALCVVSSLVLLALVFALLLVLVVLSALL
jgi:hypothetical protein